MASLHLCVITFFVLGFYFNLKFILGCAVKLIDCLLDKPITVIDGQTINGDTLILPCPTVVDEYRSEARFPPNREGW